jgi:hypothetical protein
MRGFIPLFSILQKGMMIMANKIKGQRSFEVNGEKYTNHFDFNALAELEDATGMDTTEVMKELDRMRQEERISIRLLRTLTWSGLLRHHDLSIKEVGELMSEADLVQLSTAVGEAFATSLMTEEEWEKLQKKQKEAMKQQAIQSQKKKNGTGKKSE